MLKDRLARARKEQRLSREALAEKAGVSTSTITFLENGRNESSKFLVEIASALGVTAEWLKGESEIQHPSNAEKLPISIGQWDSKSELPDDMFEVPFFLDMSLSAGYGAMNSDILPGGAKLWYSKAFLRRRNICFENVFCIKVNGDSMSPVFEDGGVVLIDIGAKDIIDGKPYAITYQDGDYIKFIRRLPDNKIRIISANEEYESFDAHLEEVVIIGQVKEYSQEW